jgi:hypothetical protein
MAFKDAKKKVEPVQAVTKPVKEFAAQGLPEPARGLSASETESLKRAVTEELKREYLGTPSDVRERIAQLEAGKANAELEIVRLKDETAKAKQAKAEAETETAKVNKQASADHDDYKVRFQELIVEKETVLQSKAEAEAKVAEAEKGKAEAEAKVLEMRGKEGETKAKLMEQIQQLKNELALAEGKNKVVLQRLENEKVELNTKLEQAKTATAEAVTKAKSEVAAVDPQLADKVKELDGLMDEAGPLLVFVEELDGNEAFKKLVSVARDILAFHENMENASLNSKVQSLLEGQDKDVCMDELRTLVAEFSGESVKAALEIASVEAELDSTRKLGKWVLKQFPGLFSEVSGVKQQVEDALRQEDPTEGLGNLVVELSQEAVISLLKGIKREDGELAGKAADALKEAGAE